MLLWRGGCASGGEDFDVAAVSTAEGFAAGMVGLEMAGLEGGCQVPGVQQQQGH